MALKKEDVELTGNRVKQAVDLIVHFVKLLLETLKIGSQPHGQVNQSSSSLRINNDDCAHSHIECHSNSPLQPPPRSHSSSPALTHDLRDPYKLTEFKQEWKHSPTFQYVQASHTFGLGIAAFFYNLDFARRGLRLAKMREIVNDPANLEIVRTNEAQDQDECDKKLLKYFKTIVLPKKK
eukprot:275230_1